MSDDAVYTHLHNLAGTAFSGDKVPSVRQLMKQFNRSQLVIERALARLKAEGLIQAEGGRGTFFVGRSQKPTRATASSVGRSILILRRSVSIRQGQVVLEDLREQLTAEGHRLLEVSYTDAEHARTVLKTMPKFDTCIIQNSFEPVSIDTLAAIKHKADSIVFHGLGITGSEVDCVGHEWGGAISQALRLLEKSGHESIAFATTAFPNIANAMGKRRFHEYSSSRGVDPARFLIELSKLPHEDYEEGLAKEIESRRGRDGKLPFTALIAWGVESGARLRRHLNDGGISLPGDLGIVLLGHPDMRHEHDDFFSIIGPTAAAQARGLHTLMHHRWREPSAPSMIVFLESETNISHSSIQRIGSANKTD